MVVLRGQVSEAVKAGSDGMLRELKRQMRKVELEEGKVHHYHVMDIVKVGGSRF